MELHESEWKAVRVRVVLRVARHALLPQLCGPWRERQSIFDVLSDVRESRKRRIVAGLRFKTIGPPSRPLGGCRLSQVPEKSILPLERRGGGALRSGLPSAVRGVSFRKKVATERSGSSRSRPQRPTQEENVAFTFSPARISARVGY
jgi:hypothetical protein